MEIWRTVVYDGEIYENYEVSDLGRVRSLNYNRTGEIKVLKQSENTGGYLFLNLYKNQKMKMCLSHRIVAYTFYDLIPNDNPTEKTDINHINENKHDNRVENLEWTTHKENINHGTCIERRAKKQTETMSQIMSEKCGKRVRCIETGIIYETLKIASEETKLDKASISKCCNGKLKSCGGLHWEFVD